MREIDVITKAQSWQVVLLAAVRIRETCVGRNSELVAQPQVNPDSTIAQLNKANTEESSVVSRHSREPYRECTAWVEFINQSEPSGSSYTSEGSKNSGSFEDSRRSDEEYSEDGASYKEGGFETP
nr:hypothetical protein [Tanacetum cinerariifolium]